MRIGIQPEGIALEEVVITVEEKKEEEIRLSPTVSNVPINVTTLRKMPSIAGEMDVLRAIQAIPGVKSSSEISSALYVRGGSPDQTLILMDHNPVFNPSHMFGLFSTFNADAVKHLELKKGAFPAYYGGRSGSVLEVITKEGNRKKTEGLASLSIISARASIEGPLPKEKGSYALSARRTYFDPVISAIRSAGDGMDLPNYYFWDGNAKINFDLDERTTLTTAGYWGFDNMDFEMGADDNRFKMDLRWGNRTLSSRLRHAYSRNMFGSYMITLSRYFSSFGFDNDGVLVDRFHNTFLEYSFKSDWEFLGKEKHKFMTGIIASRYLVDFREENEDYTYVDVDEHTFNYSIYGQDNWRIHPLFEIQPGLRCYFHQAGNQFVVDPRLAFVYYYGPQTRFKLAGGRYSQFVNVITFGEGFNNFDIWIPVDHSMSPSFSNQIVLGFEKDYGKEYEFTTETYYTDMHNIANFDYLVTTSDEASDAFVMGKGFAYGWEVMLRKKTGRLSGWLGYSLSWTKRQFPNSYINSGNWYYPIWDRRHDFIAVGTYNLSKKWDVSGTWRYNTGQGFTQAVGVSTIYLAGIDPSLWGNDARWIIPGSMNNYRFPADHRLDLTFSYKHKFFKGLPATLDISIYNAYNRRAYWRRLYDTNENPIEVTDVKLLPIVPLVSYEVRF
jgi:outer membrane cobalamin receptor